MIAGHEDAPDHHSDYPGPRGRRLLRPRPLVLGGMDRKIERVAACAPSTTGAEPKPPT